MSNGSQVCCLTGVCCPTGSQKQLDGWVKMIQQERPQFTHGEALAAALRVLKAHHNFDDVVGLIDHPL